MRRRLVPLILALLTLSLAACGQEDQSAGDGSAGAQPATTTDKTPPKAKPTVATKASFTRCLRGTGVALDPKGGVPGDPSRTKRPRGLNDPVAGAEYLGAASFAKGGFADVWIADSGARATDLSDGLADPSLNPPEAKDWSFDHSRNILFAIHAIGTGKLGDPSGKKFDRCLRSG